MGVVRLLAVVVANEQAAILASTSDATEAGSALPRPDPAIYGVVIGPGVLGGGVVPC